MLPTRFPSAWPSPAATQRSPTASSKPAATSSPTTWRLPAWGPATTSGAYGRNSIELVATFLACYKLRAIAVNVNYRYVESRAAATCSPRPSWSAWCTTASSATGSRRCCRSSPASGPCWPSTTAAMRRLRPAPTSRRRPPVRPPTVTSASAAPTTSTCSTPAAPPVTRRACSGGMRTSGGRWAAASTSPPASGCPMSGSSPSGPLQRPPAWSGSARRR